MAVLEERGRFWWSDISVPDGQFAPDESITGLLRIDEDGRIALDLNEYFPNERGPFGLLAQDGAPISKSISGILRESNKRVLLTGLHPGGGQVRSAGISHQRFIATDCLVGDAILGPNDLPPKFAGLEIDLSGLESWFWFRSVKVSRSYWQITADYKRPEPAIYDIEDGKLTFDFYVDGSIPYPTLSDEISIKERARAIFDLTQRESIDQLRDRFRFFEDLIILLTDSEYRLAWPILRWSEDTAFTWYYARIRSEDVATAPERHECLTFFPRVRQTFGALWNTWQSKRQEFGPGFYLYLGTRRGFSLYTEHRFVNLIWGLEAFHRTKHPANPDSLKDRIENIVTQIADKSDQKLVRRGLRFAHEPTLEERLFSVFKDLPLSLDRRRLRAFAHDCANARNSISHFGAQGHGHTYSEFILDLEKKSRALATLSHCLLLHEIGVDAEIIVNWTSKGWGSFRIKYNFVEVGLLDKEVLKPDPPPASPS